MRWISGAFPTTLITALEVITGIPPLTSLLNIQIFKYAIRVNKLSSSHPIRRLARIRISAFDKFRIRIKPSAYEKHTTFNICKDVTYLTDEQFTYSHPEQIRGRRILDLFHNNIKFVNYDHPKRDSDLFTQWFKDFQLWLNTIRNERDHLLIATDRSFKKGSAVTAGAFLINQELAHEFAHEVSAHSSFDTEIAALQYAFQSLRRLPYSRVTFLIDNENATKLIWDTSAHNLQSLSIKATVDFHHWFVTVMKHKVDIVNVSWCPSHMGIVENEHVGKVADKSELLEDTIVKSTLLSKIQDVKNAEFKKWISDSSKPNTLGHGYLRLKFKNKKIAPSFGKRRNIFYDVSDDNIKMLARITRIVINHAPTRDYRRGWHPNARRDCRFDII
ncbi:hypothetical protein AX15_003639 [Amanita polypyramis BW_CC]|nr:hypothetical protein AX15_003639 [Amanita polypyramis BW_CC]